MKSDLLWELNRKQESIDTAKKVLALRKVTALPRDYWLLEVYERLSTRYLVNKDSENCKLYLDEQEKHLSKWFDKDEEQYARFLIGQARLNLSLGLKDPKRREHGIEQFKLLRENFLSQKKQNLELNDTKLLRYIETLFNLAVYDKSTEERKHLLREAQTYIRSNPQMTNLNPQLCFDCNLILARLLRAEGKYQEATKTMITAIKTTPLLPAKTRAFYRPTLDNELKDLQEKLKGLSDKNNN